MPDLVDRAAERVVEEAADEVRLEREQPPRLRVVRDKDAHADLDRHLGEHDQRDERVGPAFSYNKSTSQLEIRRYR